MKVLLPKELRGFAYDRVVPVDLNAFNVDILLPSVFFKVMSGGAERGRVANDPTEIRAYVQALGDRVPGIDGRTLERLVRTTLIQTARQGTSRKVEQIQGFTGYTLITCKPGFPVITSTLRKVDFLIYRMMREQFDRDDMKLRAFFEHIFGQGLRMHAGAEIDGVYDGRTDLDTLTRLAIEFLAGFKSVGIRKPKERPDREVCPPVANLMARDLRRYMQAYSPYMPVEAFTYHLRALINFELFVYTVKLFSATCAVVADHRELPAQMSPDPSRDPGPTPPFLYLDFTGAASGPNREMATATCRAVLDLAQEFIKANLTLRQLDRYIRALRNSRRARQSIERVLALDSGPEYLVEMLRLRDDDAAGAEIEASARRDEEAVRAANRPEDQEDGEDEGADGRIDDLIEAGRTDLDKLILLLYEGQGQGIFEKVAQWLWNVGGLTKPYGLMGGSLRSRQSWRFMPSNDLLSTLVQLAAVNIPRWQKDEPVPEPIKLEAFLAYLDERFGILVDRPPEGFGGAEYAAAARENLRALLRRLKQMGIFRDLSDDFTVQQLVPPYLGEREEVLA